MEHVNMIKTIDGELFEKTEENRANIHEKRFILIEKLGKYLDEYEFYTHSRLEDIIRFVENNINEITELTDIIKIELKEKKRIEENIKIGIKEFKSNLQEDVK